MKQQFHLPESRFSLVELISLIEDELAKSSIRYQQQGNARADISTRQNKLIQKEYDLFVKSDSKDVAQFFSALTFNGNNGSVKGLENYIYGDENEFAEDDEGCYEFLRPERQVNGAQDNLEQQPQQQSIQPTCVVCLGNPITTMFEPCNHLKFCRDCADIIMIPQLNEFDEEITPKCPVCRTILTGKRFVYY